MTPTSRPRTSPSGDLPAIRRWIGESTALWAGGGRHEVEAGRWLTLSGARSTDYNVAACHDAGPSGPGDLFERSLADVKEAGAPAVVMAAGVALGAVQVLADAGWVCIGQTPVMHLPGAAVGPDPGDGAVRRIGPAELDAVRAVVAVTFELPPELAALAIPDEAAGGAGPMALWGLEVDGRLVSVAASYRAGPAAVFWSVATPPSEHRRGHGRRLFDSVHARLAADGVEAFVLYASPPGEALYRRLGYEVVEHWQQWSRPRWVLGGV